MTISRKTFLIIVMTTVALVGLLFIVTWTLLHRSFLTLEREAVTQTVEQIKNTVNSEYENLAMTAVNWAAWDDTYIFVDDLNDTYVDENMSVDVFDPLRIDTVMYLNTANEVVYGRSFDYKTRQAGVLSEALRAYVTTENPFSGKEQDETIKGIILLPQGPLMIATSPIVKTDLSGPTRGLVVMGRFLNADEEHYLSEIIGRSVTVMPYDQNSAELESLEPGVITTNAISNKTIVGYELITDIKGNPAAVLKTYMPRDFYARGLRSIFYFMGYTALAGLVYALIMLVLLNRIIISRLMVLRAYLKRIGENGFGSEKLNITGNDEITDLAKAAESTLAKLDRCQRKNGE